MLVINCQLTTLNFHNFKSRNFKLSVSNPESKHVAYLSVLSRISNCQGLGRKNKLEILKTDRRCLLLSFPGELLGTSGTPGAGTGGRRLCGLPTRCLLRATKGVPNDWGRNNWFDYVLLSIRYIFKPLCWPMFKPPSLGPPLRVLEFPLESWSSLYYRSL